MARRARATEADAPQERLAYRVAGFSRSTIERAIKDGRVMLIWSFGGHSALAAERVRNDGDPIILIISRG
jgi:hypothetical protein